jgi:hypothetical protein
MKLSFQKRDTAGRLRAETAASATAAAKVVELRAERDGALHADGDDLAAIVRLDAKVSEQERICSLYRERIAGLDRELAKEHQAERQKLKGAAIAALEPGLAAHIASAGKLEAALINFQACLEQYEETSGGWGSPWRFDLFPPAGEFLRQEHMSAGIARDLRIERGQSLKIGIGHAVANIKGLSEYTATRAATFLADLRAATLPPEGDAEEAA